MSHDLSAGLLRELRDAEVESVVFVRDYVQFTFWLPDCSPRLTLYAWPTIRSVDGLRRSFGDAGYRDELCRLLYRVVAGTDEQPESGLVLAFDSGQALMVRPARSDLFGPEIGILQMNDDGQQRMVWRPGETPFAEDHWA